MGLKAELWVRLREKNQIKPRGPRFLSGISWNSAEIPYAHNLMINPQISVLLPQMGFRRDLILKSYPSQRDDADVDLASVDGQGAVTARRVVKKNPPTLPSIVSGNEQAGKRHVFIDFHGNSRKASARTGDLDETLYGQLVNNDFAHALRMALLFNLIDVDNFTKGEDIALLADTIKLGADALGALVMATSFYVDRAVMHSDDPSLLACLSYYLAITGLLNTVISRSLTLPSHFREHAKDSASDYASFLYAGSYIETLIKTSTPYVYLRHFAIPHLMIAANRQNFFAGSK